MARYSRSTRNRLCRLAPQRRNRSTETHEALLPTRPLGCNRTDERATTKGGPRGPAPHRIRARALALVARCIILILRGCAASQSAKDRFGSSNPDFRLGGRTSASAECRHWSARAVRWSSCAILLRSARQACAARAAVLGVAVANAITLAPVNDAVDRRCR